VSKETFVTDAARLTRLGTVEPPWSGSSKESLIWPLRRMGLEVVSGPGAPSSVLMPEAFRNQGAFDRQTGLDARTGVIYGGR
jgi:hypothetical protein